MDEWPLDDIFPGLQDIADLTFDSPALRAFKWTRMDLALLELLKDGGIAKLGDIGQRNELELRALLGIGAQKFDEVLDLTSRVVGAVGPTFTLDDTTGLPTASFDTEVFDEAQPPAPSDTPVVRGAWVGNGPGSALRDDSPKLGNEFPSLREIANIGLDDPVLRVAQRVAGDEMAHRWLQWTRVTTVGELLDLQRQDFREVRNLGPSKVERLYEYLGRLADSAPTISGSALMPSYRPPRLAATTGLPTVSFDTDVMDEPQPPAARDIPVVRGARLGTGQTSTFRTGDSRKVGNEFPSLREIADIRLDDPVLRVAQGVAGDEMAHRWLQWTRLSTVGELLNLQRQDFRDVRNLGPSKLGRLYDYLGRLADSAPTISGSADRSSNQPHLRMVLDWATSIGGAKTWSDALGMLDDSLPDDVAMALDELLTSALPSRQVRSALTDYLEADPRASKVLAARVTNDQRLTLQEVSTELGVTRERVRQIESQAIGRMREALASDSDWQHVRWAADRLTKLAGSFAPSMELERALPRWSPNERCLVALLAGYERWEPELARSGLTLPRLQDLPLLPDTDFAIDEFVLVERLESMGVRPGFLDFAIANIAQLSRVDGQLVVWRGSVVDKAIAVLEVRDEPCDVEQLVIAAYGDSSSRSARHRILEDPRVMRVTKTKVGLRRWGGARYTGVAELMRDRLASGPMDVDELADELAAKYEVSTASVRMYGAAPAFKMTGNTIALRSGVDPFVPRDKPSKVQGLYRLHSASLTVWCVLVDIDLLRGSGRALPREIAIDLGVAPGHGCDVQTPVGAIQIAWSETSTSGPHIGSLRKLVSASGASLGDHIALRFEYAERTLDALVTSATTDQSDPAAEIARRTSLPDELTSHPALVAATVEVSEESLVTALEARGDGDIASLIQQLRANRAPHSARPQEPSRPREQSRDDAVGAELVVNLEARGSTGHLPATVMEDPHPGGEILPAGMTTPVEQRQESLAGVAHEYARNLDQALNQMRIAGYDPRALRRLVSVLGAREASEMIVGLADQSEAFVAMYRLNRLDLSVEAHVASKLFRTLFAGSIVDKAVARLAEHGFDVVE